MNTSKKMTALIASAAAGVFGAQKASAAIVTQYSFSGSSPTPSPTQVATTGTGTATSLGMTNSYNYNGGEGPGAVDGSNIVSTPGTANPSFTEDVWRIVGNSNASGAGAGMANGWNNSAPNYTQGAEFGANLTGYTPTTLTFDWYSTTQGVGNLQVLYSLTGTPGSFVALGSDLLATPNDFYGGASGSPTNTVSLAGISGAANDPTFAIELVSVRPVPGDADYSATGPGGDGNYAAAKGDTSSATAVDYNNSSGNWRFDNVTFNGTAVPEPTSASVLGLAGLALLGRRRAKKA